MLRIQIRAQLTGQRERAGAAAKPKANLNAKPKKQLQKYTKKHGKQKPQKRQAMSSKHNGVGAADAEAKTKSEKTKKKQTEVEEEKNVAAESVDQKGARNKKQQKTTRVLRQTMIHFN